MIGAIRKLLAHPATRDLSIDDPRTTERRREIIQSNRFLWRIYDEWYRMIAARIPQGAGGVVELGHGSGFLEKYIAGLITSEVFPCRGVHLVLDGRSLPFATAGLKALVMVNVLHHVPGTREFLGEARRCLRPGGCIVMIEPWVSTWARAIYPRLHHEWFHPEADDWTFPAAGPLSGANGALPWIIFESQRRVFEAEFPEFEIATVRPIMPFRYLVSGGVSLRQLMPSAMFPLWRGIDGMFGRWPRRWPMFALIQVRRR